MFGVLRGLARPLWNLFRGAKPGTPRIPATWPTSGGRVPGTPAVPKGPDVPAGFLNPKAHKLRFGGALGTAASLPFFLGGDEEEAPMPPSFPLQAGLGEQASLLPSSLERATSSRQKWMKNLQTMTMHQGILNAIDPEAAKEYSSDVTSAMKTMAGYTQNMELARITDAAIKKDQTPRERYMAMMKEGATPDEAALVSGHQVEILKAEQTSMGAKAQVWDNIMQTLMAGNVEAAALMLVQAWGTGQLGGAPITENFEQRIETARLYLTGIMEGETAATAPGAGSGITDISLS